MWAFNVKSIPHRVAKENDAEAEPSGFILK